MGVSKDHSGLRSVLGPLFWEALVYVSVCFRYWVPCAWTWEGLDMQRVPVCMAKTEHSCALKLGR